VEIAVRDSFAPPAPCLCDVAQLAGGQLGDRSRVPRRMDDDLLALERGVEVRHDPNAPRVADPQRLGRRAVLPTRAEGALLELRFRRRVELGLRGARPLRARGRDRDAPAGQRISS
jgi:hypothetical protein